MRSARWAAGMLFVAVAASAAPPLFSDATESKWSVTHGRTKLGAITLLTGAQGTRGEWRSTGQSTTTVFLGGQGKVWQRSTGGDIELATISATSPENLAVPALLLPFTISSMEKVETKDGKPSAYSYRGARAVYHYDGKGPLTVDVTNADGTYTITRTSVATSHAAADTFAIRPKKAAASRLARLSGDLLGPSDSTVSATAGGRGAGHEGLKLNDGGDYDQVAQLERRDKAWKAKLDDALSEFQKDGKVGKERENR
ncbi:MAG: hypothetical protein ABI837_04095 [Acidobacteriota bacterium]